MAAFAKRLEVDDPSGWYPEETDSEQPQPVDTFHVNGAPVDILSDVDFHDGAPVVHKLARRTPITLGSPLAERILKYAGVERHPNFLAVSLDQISNSEIEFNFERIASTEVWGMHGTVPNAVDNIIQSGFLPGEEGLLGRGVYVTDTLRKAHNYTYPRLQPDGSVTPNGIHRYVFICRVKPGKQIHMENNTRYDLRRYGDSLMADFGSGPELMAYQKERVLPCYLLKYVVIGREWTEYEARKLLIEARIRQGASLGLFSFMDSAVVKAFVQFVQDIVALHPDKQDEAIDMSIAFLKGDMCLYGLKAQAEPLLSPSSSIDLENNMIIYKYSEAIQFANIYTGFDKEPYYRYVILILAEIRVVNRQIPVVLSNSLNTRLKQLFRKQITVGAFRDWYILQRGLKPLLPADLRTLSAYVNFDISLHMARYL